jgi:D-alanyl-D-alanine carboxypeptidase
MCYPDGKTDRTCYDYEPWHYRYLGRDLAKQIHDSGLTIREYLWANFTQVDPDCVALPAPTLVTPGTPRSCAFPSATNGPTAIPPVTAPPATGLATPGPSSTGGLGSQGPTVPPDTTNVGTSVGPAAIIGFAGVAILALIGIVALSRRRAAGR